MINGVAMAIQDTEPRAHSNRPSRSEVTAAPAGGSASHHQDPGWSARDAELVRELCSMGYSPTQARNASRRASTLVSCVEWLVDDDARSAPAHVTPLRSSFRPNAIEVPSATRPRLPVLAIELEDDDEESDKDEVQVVWCDRKPAASVTPVAAPKRALESGTAGRHQRGGAARSTSAARREGSADVAVARGDDGPLPFHLDVHVHAEALRLLLCSGLGLSVDQVLNALEHTGAVGGVVHVDGEDGPIEILEEQVQVQGEEESDGASGPSGSSGSGVADRCASWIFGSPEASRAVRDWRRPLAGMPRGGGAREAALCLRLREEKGLGWAQARAQALSAFRRTSCPQRAYALATGLWADDPEPKVFDVIAQEAVAASHTYAVDCPRAHRVAIESAFQCVAFHLGEGRVPCCPRANEGDGHGCAYTLTQQEIEQILNLHFTPDTPPSAAEVARLDLRREASPSFAPQPDCGDQRKDMGGMGRWYSERARVLVFRRSCERDGCVLCPQPGCETPVCVAVAAMTRTRTMGPVQQQQQQQQQRVACPRCAHVYCSACRQPYHYATRCEELMTLRRQWLDWQRDGRQHYLQAMAAADNSFQAALQRYKAAATQVHEAEAAFKTLQEDEGYKAGRCRHCPQCRRVIEKLDGCDAMVCGMNAHGSWDQAAAYVADTGNRPEVPTFADVPPERAARCRHMIADDVPLCCSVCSSAIVGPLAECVHCPPEQEVRCVDCQGAPHTNGHIFRLHMEPKGGAATQGWGHDEEEYVILSDDDA